MRLSHRPQRPWHPVPLRWHPSPRSAVYVVASIAIRSHAGPYTPWHPLPSTAMQAMAFVTYGIRCRHGIRGHPCELRIRCKLWHPLPAMASVAIHGKNSAPVAPASDAEPRCRSPAPEAYVVRLSHRPQRPWHPVPLRVAPIATQCRVRYGIRCHPCPCKAVLRAHARPYTPWHPLPSIAMQAMAFVQPMASVAAMASIAIRASLASNASYGIRCQLWHPLPSVQAIAMRASHGIR